MPPLPAAREVHLKRAYPVERLPEGSRFWFREPEQEGTEVVYLCDEIIYSGRSPCQQIDIVNTRMYGRMLFLDGIAQSAEHDEFIYHEMLVHPALFSHWSPRSVLIIGGAEGATLREVFRHPGIRRVVMVDIDRKLIEICRRYLPQWHRGSFDDPRLELVIGDGRAYLERTSETFDAVILDLSDPVEGSPARRLFTREFYDLVRVHLNRGACAAVQGEGISPPGVELHARMVHTLKSVFPVVRPYPYFLHSFHRPDAHILVTEDEGWSPQRLAANAEGGGLPLDYFCPDMARGMFILPPYLHKAYLAQNQVVTDENCGFDFQAARFVKRQEGEKVRR